MTSYHSFDNLLVNSDNELSEYKNHAHISEITKKEIRNSCITYICVCLLCLMSQILIIGYNFYVIIELNKNTTSFGFNNFNNFNNKYNCIQAIHILFLILQIYDTTTLLCGSLFTYSVFINMTELTNSQIEHLNIVKKCYWFIKLTINKINLMMKLIIFILSFFLFMIFIIAKPSLFLSDLINETINNKVIDSTLIINFIYNFESCFIIVLNAFTIINIQRKILIS